MKLPVAMASLLTILVVPITAGAQEAPSGGLILQVGVSYGVPLGDFKETTGSLADAPETGYATSALGIDVRALFPVSRRLGIYVDWYRPHFDADTDAMLAELGLPPQTPLEFNYTLKSFGVGARVTLPIPLPVEPYVEAGLSRYKAELHQVFQGIDDTGTSETTNGFNLGAGVTYPLGGVYLNGGLRYHTVRFVVEGIELDWQTSWLEIGLGVSIPLSG